MAQINIFFRLNNLDLVSCDLFLDEISEQDVRESEADIDISCKSSNSRTASPLTTSGGIITKRGPQVDQAEVAFEFKLNVTETQFVVVQNLASLDTNAVILKVSDY